MLITIDPYYTIELYNESLNALENNKIDYKEFISVKPPFLWYVDIPSLPIMTNYDVLTGDKFLVNKVQPARPNEEYLLQRRNSDKGTSALEKFVLNEPLQEAKNSKYACFFNVRNREQVIELSKTLPGKIWYFGKYYNKFRVALYCDPMIKNFIVPDDILVEKTGSIFDFEVELNYKIFRLKDRLHKFTETPYFTNGKYVPVNIEQFKVTI